MNGLVSADRTPHPALFEVKKVYQYVRVTAVDLERGAVEIENLYDFTDALRASNVGDVVEVRVLRGGETINTKVTLERRR